jgi:hypothetical protein
MKTIAKKPAPKKAEPKTPVAKKPEPKKAELKKPAAKKPEAKKPEAKKPVAMKDHLIIAVHVTDRLKKVPKVQELLTKYGCNIKTRLGLHETSHEVCSANGILILEMFGDTKKCLGLVTELNKIEGIEAKSVQFSHKV